MSEVTIDDLERLASHSPVHTFHYQNMVWAAKPPSYEEWADAVGKAIAYCADCLVEVRVSYRNSDSAALTSALCLQLALLGFDAQARQNDTVVVRLRAYAWVGTGIFDKGSSAPLSFSELSYEGDLGTAHKSRGGIVVFCNGSLPVKVLDEWRHAITAVDGVEVAAGPCTLSFSTTANSPTTGLAIQIVYVFVPWIGLTASQKIKQSNAAPALREKHVVVLIHGIRTHGVWAEMVAGRLRRAGIDEVIPLRYGYFDLFRFLIPGPTRKKPIERIVRELRDIRRAHLYDHVSVIAHSYGTYAFSKVLAERDLFFHRVVFCGSIIPSGFRKADYAAQLDADPIINDCGTLDVWPVIASAVTWGYGSTGTFGFGTVGITDRFHPFDHGAFFDEKFVDEYWVPFLRDGEVATREWAETRRPPQWHMSLLSLGIMKYLVWGAGFVLLGAVAYWVT